MRIIAIVTAALALAFAGTAGASPAKNLPHYRVPPRVTSTTLLAPG